MSEPLIMWVVYDHPADLPDYWFARKWQVDAGGYYPTKDYVGFLDLDKLHLYFREQLGLAFLCRHKDDDARILGTYV